MARVLVTGGASGLGLALAEAFLARGDQVLAGDLAEERPAILPEQVVYRRLDVRQPQDWDAAAAWVSQEWGGLDILCNNAGVAAGGRIDVGAMSEWERVIDINLLGVVRGCQTFVPMLKEQRSGHIVNTASAAGLTSFPGMAAYNVSKHGVVTLSETLYQELQMTRSPIGLSLLCPAWVPTGIARADRNRPADAGTTKPVEGISAVINQRIGRAIATGTLSADDMASETSRPSKKIARSRSGNWNWGSSRTNSRRPVAVGASTQSCVGCWSASAATTKRIGNRRRLPRRRNT